MLGIIEDVAVTGSYRFFSSGEVGQVVKKTEELGLVTGYRF